MQLAFYCFDSDRHLREINFSFYVSMILATGVSLTGNLLLETSVSMFNSCDSSAVCLQTDMILLCFCVPSLCNSTQYD